MDNRDRSNLGDQIRKSVEDAIDSMDFRQLNKVISDTVGSALEEAKKNLDKQEESYKKPDRAQPGSSREYQPGYKPFSSYKGDRFWESGTSSASGEGSKTGEQKGKDQLPAVRYQMRGRVSGILFTVFGGIGLGVTGTLLLILILVALIVEPLQGAAGIASGVLALLGGGFAIMLALGNSKRGRLNRLKTYISEAGDKRYCSLEELSRVVGRPKQFVAKDLEKMIGGGFLPEAHLDEKKTCLMLDHTTYRQYLETQKGYEERIRIEAGKKPESKAAARKSDSAAEQEKLPEDLRRMIDEGRDYVKVLRQANEAIPDECISKKLTRLETVISRIFQTVEKHPEQKDEMGRFMEYYLPTTVKLVNAYRDFNSLEVAGNNIASAKQEIDNTLDTINKAFEQFLDDLYQNAALDVSTDASVLQTMLKSEGYGDCDFRRKDHE